jgi:hypothetical protein
MMRISYAQAEQVAEALAPRWQGITGHDAAPSTEAIADLVQFVLRKADELRTEAENAD